MSPYPSMMSTPAPSKKCPRRSPRARRPTARTAAARRGVAQLPVHQAVEHRVLGLDAAADAAPAPRLLRVVDGDSGGALEDPLLRALAGPALRHAVHLLEGARHGDDEGGLELLHLRHQPGRRCSRTRCARLRSRTPPARPGQRMCASGRKASVQLSSSEHLAQRGGGLAGVPDQVAVGERGPSAARSCRTCRRACRGPRA